jgi:hypothetical protein
MQNLAIGSQAAFQRSRTKVQESGYAGDGVRSGIVSASLNAQINTSVQNSAFENSRALRSVMEGHNEEDGNGSGDDANSWNVGDKDVDGTASQSKDSLNIMNFKSTGLINAASK